MIEFIELTQQRDAGIIEQQIQRRKGSDRGRGEVLDLLGICNIDPLNGHSARMRGGNLLGHRLESRLV
jgi:hypothetical protein